MKRFLYIALMLLSATILLSVGFSVDSSRADDSTKIDIAYSGNIMGYFEPCG